MTVPWQASATRLVGRRAELDHLRRLVQRARSRSAGGMVLLLGEAGVGKSRLVREVAGWAAESGVLVLSGRAVPSGEAYRPVVEALTRSLRDRPLPTGNALRPYLPVLATLLPDARGQGGPAAGVVHLGEAVLRLLTALADGRGTLLVLEDLHWADPDTLDLLTYLASAGDSAPLLVVGTARDEAGVPQPLVDLVAASSASVLRLERLDAAGVRGVVEACLTGRPPDALVDFLVEHADGLPFLVEELLTGLASVGAVAPDGRLTGQLTANVPQTFAATVLRRLSDLDPAARCVTEVAAVLGRRFDWRLLAEILDVPPATVLAGLRAAVASGLVAVDDDPDRFRFRHALTCDAVLDSLLPPERRALALAAAAVVERRQPDAYDLAAGLRAAGGDDARAAELYVRAGAQAWQRGALRSADLLLSRAAAVAVDRPALRREAETALLQVLAGTGEADRALGLGERLLAEPTPARMSVGEDDRSVRLTLAEVAAAAGRWDVAEARLSALPDDGEPRARVLAARLAHARGRPEEARTIADGALRTARERGQWSVACQALEVVGRAARVADLAAARDAFADAEQIATEHDLPVERVSALHELGTVDLLADGSVDRLEQARLLALDAGVLAVAATVDLQIAASRLHRDADDSLVHALRSADLAHRLRMDRLEAAALFFQAAAHAHRREDEDMTRCVQQAEKLAPDDLDVRAGIWGAVHAHVALLDDDRPALAQCLDRAMRFLRRSAITTPAPTRGLWALVRTLGDRDGETAREEVRPFSVNWENRALLGYADAVSAGRLGRTEEAQRTFAEADAALAGHRWWRHRLRLLVADDALAHGWGEPVAWAREALPAFTQRGDDKLAARCRDVLRRAGAPVPRAGRGASPVPPHLRALGVTSREIDVLQLIAAGLTNAAIAQRLVLSPRTVETHVASLLAKTGADGRPALAALLNSGPAGN